MSLLMDALKKAELAKRQGAASDATAEEPQSSLSLEPLAEAPATPATPDRVVDQADAPPEMSLSSHLEELDARFLEEVAAAARQVPPSPAAQARVEPTLAPAAALEPAARPNVEPPRQPQRDPMAGEQAKSAAQNVFAAKKPEKQEGRKTFAIAVGILTVLSVVGIAGYFWWQLQPKGSLAVRPVPPVVSVPAPAAPTVPTAPVAAAPVPPAPSPAPQAAPATSTSAPAIAAGTPPQPAQAAAAPEKSAAADRPTQRTRRAARAEEADDDSPIRITREPLKVNPALARGYDAFNRGEWTLAQLEYEKVRKSDPRNVDALHGLAAIALRQGQYDQAEFLYRQIVEADPQDTIALSALLNQRGQVDPNFTESRLKSLAAAQPDNAAPHFSLGNLYARSGRWNDAQQAYFRAYNADPENPDILYNLAVSLEHIRQPKIAAKYYAQAITAAEQRPAGFDRGQAAARLKSLQP